MLGETGQVTTCRGPVQSQPRFLSRQTARPATWVNMQESLPDARSARLPVGCPGKVAEFRSHVLSAPTRGSYGFAVGVGGEVRPNCVACA